MKRNKKRTLHTEGHWLLSKRWTVAYMGFMGAVSLYLMRVNASIAVVCMTSDALDDTKDNSTITHISAEYQEFLAHLDAHCPNDVESSVTQQLININNSFVLQNTSSREIFTWNRQLRGWILSSFYISYVPMQLPSAWLARKFGAKKVILAGGILNTMATFLSPVAARTSVYLLMVMQVLKGIGHAPILPCMQHLWSSWAPPLERTKLAVFVISGNSMGSILAFAISGYLCEYGFDGGWPSLFYVYGMFACLWLVLWQLLVYDSPEDHPRISEKEKNYILNSTGVHKKHTSNMRVPWLAIATSPRMWAIIIGDLCFNWMFYVFLATLPQYMKDILRFDIKKNGLFTALPYVTMLLFSIIFSFLIDALRSHHIMTTTNVRRMAATVDLILPAILLIPLGFMDCTQYLGVIALLCFAVALGGANRSGPFANTLDIAPRYAGIIVGITNTTSNIPGFVVPAVVAAMTSTGLPSEWRNVFYTSAGIQVFGWLVYVIFSSGDVQPWALVESDLGNTQQIHTELLQKGENEAISDQKGMFEDRIDMQRSKS